MILGDLSRAFVDGREVEKLNVVRGRVFVSALELISIEDFEASSKYIVNLAARQREFGNEYHDASSIRKFVYTLGQWFG